METVIDPYTIQYDFGREGATEETAQHAHVWDGPVLVAILMRIGDEWVIDHFDTDYAETHGMPDGWDKADSFVVWLKESDA